MQLSSLAHIAVAVVLPPLLPGVIARTKAAFAGRQGPPVLPLAQAGPVLSWVAFCATLIALAVVIGVIESIMARLRLVRVPMLLVTACLLSAFALILLFT